MPTAKLLKEYKESQDKMDRAYSDIMFYAYLKKRSDIPFEELYDSDSVVQLPTINTGMIVMKKVEYTDDSITYICDFLSSAVLTLHKHSNAQETIKIISGRLLLEIGDSEITKRLVLEKGDEVIIPRNVYHQAHSPYDCRMEITFDKIN